ncbi:MAG: hypothetical protein K2K44_07705 [Oscillospiraceae bacterium]|nr:hypothetical protein [Oscillospiraceae bacterium]
MRKLNVCKECGECGVNLILNEDLLCPECVDLKNKEMSSKEVADEMVNWYYGKSDANRVEAYRKALEDKAKRETKNFNYLFSNYEKARKLEKIGEDDKALAIYLKMLNRIPTGTSYYVRSCIILEKKHEYQKAIGICDMALQAINEGRFGGNVKGSEDEILHRRERLVKKLEKSQKQKGGQQ